MFGHRGGRHGEGAMRGTAGRTRLFGQGDLRLVVLELLQERPRHGYEVIKAIEERVGGDYSPSPGFQMPPNLAALRFREEDGSYLVGAIAGLATRSHVVGFVGGMQIPLIRKFEAGYAAGVAKTCPTCRLVSAYAGTEPKAFADPPLGQELASAQYGEGADIIFHAAGKTGDGVFAAARQRGARAIGVDSDQFDAAPCCVMTSMIKRVDVAVLDVVRAVIAHRFVGGVHELGLAEGGVAFVADERNARLLPAELVAEARRLQAEIIAGHIVVPST